MTKPTAKPGKYGTLRLIEAVYTDACDPLGFGRQTHRVWAYDLEHAVEKFFEGHEEEGWRLLSVAYVPESEIVRKTNLVDRTA